MPLNDTALNAMGDHLARLALCFLRGSTVGARA